MKTIDIEISNTSEGLNDFADVYRRTQTGEAIAPQNPRIGFNSLRELFSTITPKRLELTQYVAGHEGLNTRQLSQALARDYKNVHTDVAALLDLGLLNKNNIGILTAPYDDILIHASIRHNAA